MTRIAHLGPPLCRQGGPAGYLYQLERAAREARIASAVSFPPPAPSQPSPAPPSLARRARTVLGTVKRALVGSAPPHRPSDEALQADHGHVALVMQTAREAIVSDASASISLALKTSPDVFFCHDAPTAEHLLEQRARGQQVWMMAHNPMPLALYLVWNWGVPERRWQDVLALPDVKRGVAWELDVWRAVDRLVLPCAEAMQEIARIDPAAAAVTTPTDFVLSGASADATARCDRDAARKAWDLPIDRPVGLYLGNHQPYRGLDILMAAACGLDRHAPAGIVAVAGPSRAHVTTHPRLRALGHVSRVAELLTAVDFVVNVNRFSLFDLSTIEALEAGKALLLHATGGNHTFRALGAGVEMLPDLDVHTVARGLARMFAMPAQERMQLEAMSRACHAAHLTRSHLWSRHRALYERVPAVMTA